MRILTVLAFALLFAAPAFAQDKDMRAVLSRLDQVQRQMDTISRQVYKGETPPAAALGTPALPSADNAQLAAAVDERMNGLEGSIKQINNRLDEQDYAIGQMKQQFDLQKSDIEMRMKEIGAGAKAPVVNTMPVPSETQSATPPATTTPAAEAAATTPAAGNATDDTRGDTGDDTGDVKDLPTDNAAALYDAAFQALREQKYDRAEKGFTEFMARYPKDQLAGNAQYWLGETYYVRGNYADAAKNFAQGYQKYPKSSKAPDNLLKLGLSLSQQNKKPEACVTLQQLGKQYANAAAVIKQRAEDEAKKLNCAAPATTG